MESVYNAQFFSDMDAAAAKSADVIAPILVEAFRPRSVVDIGGGRGAWAGKLGSLGIEDLLCVDGSYVDQGSLLVPQSRFRSADLTTKLDLRRTFDLAICLEVAEHLPESAAEELVTSCVRHANTIIFSAAIPRQSGTHHVNEQWPNYWAQKFARRGYNCFDFVRWQIWNDPNVAWWYKQNMLVYMDENAIAALSPDSPVFASRVHRPACIIHQDATENILSNDNAPRFSEAARALIRAAALSARYHLRALRSSLKS